MIFPVGDWTTPPIGFCVGDATTTVMTPVASSRAQVAGGPMTSTASLNWYVPGTAYWCSYVPVRSARTVSPQLINPAFAPEVPPSPKWTSSLSSVPGPRIWTVNTASVPGNTWSGLTVAVTVSACVVAVVEGIDVAVLEGELFVLVVGMLRDVLAEFLAPHDATANATRPTAKTHLEYLTEASWPLLTNCPRGIGHRVPIGGRLRCPGRRRSGWPLAGVRGILLPTSESDLRHFSSRSVGLKIAGGMREIPLKRRGCTYGTCPE